MTTQLQVGDKVGAGRFPLNGKPWSGILLSVCDPRAWKGTLAFPVPDSEDSDWLPDVQKIREHVVRCATRGDNISGLPVLWDFGAYKRVWWERPESLVPYEEEYREWKEKHNELLESHS